MYSVQYFFPLCQNCTQRLPWFYFGDCGVIPVCYHHVHIPVNISLSLLFRTWLVDNLFWLVSYRGYDSLSVTGTLDLTGMNVLQETCDALTHVLNKSTVIFSVNLSDCLLSPNSLSAILKSLARSNNVITVNLKGNNIAGPSIARVGQMIQHNSSIQR